MYFYRCLWINSALFQGDKFCFRICFFNLFSHFSFKLAINFQLNLKLKSRTLPLTKRLVQHRPGGSALVSAMRQEDIKK